MQQEQVWRWVFRDPVTGRVRTDGSMTAREAAHFPGAVRIPAIRRRLRNAHERIDFEDTHAGAFRTTSAHVD